MDLRQTLGGLMLVSVCIVGCQPTPHPGGPIEALKHDIALELGEIVNEDETLPGASVHIIAPALDMDWSLGAGFADAEHSIAMTSMHPVRISSVTKTFVAASVLRLVEQGKVELDAAISVYLPTRLTALLDQGPYDPDAITIRHLLTHTSGIVDSFNTESFADYFASVLAGGDTKSFTLAEQVEAAVRGGDPTGAPGERQTYSDTGYILLGALLEELTQRNMGEAVRGLSGYGALDFHSTWWEIFESNPTTALTRARQFYGEFDGDDFGAAPFDLFGGGGMISSTEDLARYFWALLHGEVFDSADTLEVMKTRPKMFGQAREGGPVLGHGLQIFEVDGHTLYGHSGWWGVVVYYSPDHDLLVAMNWLQQHAGRGMTEHAQTIISRLMQQVEEKEGP